MKLEFTLPWPPSTNNYYRAFHNRVVISRKGREYSAHCMASYYKQIGSPKRLECRLKMFVELCAPDKRRRDLDNFGGKALLDALMKAYIIKDDSQIDDLHIVRGEIIKNGCANIILEEIE